MQQARLIRLDETTGALQPLTDSLPADDVAPFGDSHAGPKFANGLDDADPERFIAYSKVIPGTDLHVAGIRKANPNLPECGDPGQPATACFPAETDWIGQVPAGTPPAGDERRTVYTTEEENLTFRAQAVYHDESSGSIGWAKLDDFLGAQPTGVESIDENGDQVIPWARMEAYQGCCGSNALMAVTTWISAGSPQVFLIDTASGASWQITDTPGNKFIVNFSDLALLKATFYGADANADFNGDGAVNFLELGIMKSLFFLPPGPSGAVR